MNTSDIIILIATSSILSAITGWSICAYRHRYIWEDGFRACFRGATVEPPADGWQPGKPMGPSHNTPGRNPGPWAAEDAPLVIRLDEAGQWQAAPPEEIAAAKAEASHAGAILFVTVLALVVALGLALFARHIYRVETAAARARAEASAVYP